MSATASGPDSRGRLVAVSLDGGTIGPASRQAEHERVVAIRDLLESNSFEPVGHEVGEFRLTLSTADRNLIFAVHDAAGRPVLTHAVSMVPFRRLIHDYFLVCESYYRAVATGSPAHIEAIDMGRRGLHDEASTLLQERLASRIRVDFDTARQLFTLVSILHWKG